MITLHSIELVWIILVSITIPLMLYDMLYVKKLRDERFRLTVTNTHLKILLKNKEETKNGE